jgi:hypothetical protein
MDSAYKTGEQKFTLEIEEQKMLWTVEVTEWSDGKFSLYAHADSFWVGDQFWLIDGDELERGDLQTVRDYLYEFVDSYDPTPY